MIHLAGASSTVELLAATNDGTNGCTKAAFACFGNGRHARRRSVILVVLASTSLGTVPMRLTAIILAASVLTFTVGTCTNAYELLNAKRITKDIYLDNPDADGWFTVVDDATPEYRIEFSTNGDVINWGHENVQPNDILFFPNGYFRVNVANPITLFVSRVEVPDDFPKPIKLIPKRIVWIGGWHRFGNYSMHARLDAGKSTPTVSVFKEREKVGAWDVRDGDAVGATGFRITRIVLPDEETRRIGWLELNSHKPE
jgi:hypothetical protein